jgi:nitrite reductase/ring-hydroxylating ferredoxin subunit
MPLSIHVVRRSDVPENGVLVFDVGGGRYAVADIDGEVSAYAVSGPAARDLDRAAIAEGKLRCPLHGWPIDAERGSCGAAEACRYERLGVEADGDDIRIALPCP